PGEGGAGTPRHRGRVPAGGLCLPGPARGLGPPAAGAARRGHRRGAGALPSRGDGRRSQPLRGPGTGSAVTRLQRTGDRTVAMAGNITFDIGVEEEYFLIDPGTRALAPAIERVLPRARAIAGDSVATEMQQVQIEVGTDVCLTLPEVRAELARLRTAVAGAAVSAGTLIAASGTHPFSDWRASNLTPKESYLQLGRDYGDIAGEHLVFACHVHVGMPGRKETIEILNRPRPWLSPIRALAVNSPFWAG